MNPFLKGSIRIAAAAAALAVLSAARAQMADTTAPEPPPGAEPAPPPPPPVHLRFSGPDDVSDPWGKLRFGATGLVDDGKTDFPGMVIFGAPRPDGAWDIWGVTYALSPEKRSISQRSNTWKLMRARTRDGLHYDHVETILEPPAAPWMNNFAMAYNPDAGEFLLLCLKADRGGFQYTAYFSRDGRTWTLGDTNPLFYDGDAMGVFWSPALHRFVETSKSLQPVHKHIEDHGGPSTLLHDPRLRDRRVLTVRSSPDGRHWEPNVSMRDIWDKDRRKAAIPSGYLIEPDADDPPDLEFYSGTGFWMGDRAYMLMLNYAGSPLLFHKHGPHLDTEWWVSRDGLKWERPWRDVNAIGNTFPATLRLNTNPMYFGDRLCFPVNHHLLGMKRDRISYVTARANGEFSTKPFLMPEGGLLLNVACPAPERPFAGPQAYIMADVLDESGAIVPGFEASKSVIQSGDAVDLPLRWAGADVHTLAGRKIRLRFHLRSANLYAVTAGSSGP